MSPGIFRPPVVWAVSNHVPGPVRVQAPLMPQIRGRIGRRARAVRIVGKSAGVCCLLLPACLSVGAFQACSARSAANRGFQGARHVPYMSYLALFVVHIGVF